MDCKTIVDLVLTAGIVVFAYLTWRATKRYAYVTGLAMFAEAYRDVAGTKAQHDRGTGLRTIRAIRKRFPEVYEDMSECLNAADRQEIEGKD